MLDVADSVRFKDAVIDSLIAIPEDRDEKGMAYYPPVHIVSEIYEATPENAPARRLLVEMWLWHGGGNWAKKQTLESCHKSFLSDLIMKFLAERPKPAGKSPCTLSNRSSFHEKLVPEMKGVKEAPNGQKAKK